MKVDRGSSVRRLDASAVLDLLEDRLADGVTRAERIGELLAVGAEQNGAVCAGRLRNRVALVVLRPRVPGWVILQRIEVAQLGAEIDGNLRHFACCPGMVRRKLAA